MKKLIMAVSTILLILGFSAVVSAHDDWNDCSQLYEESGKCQDTPPPVPQPVAPTPQPTAPPPQTSAPNSQPTAPSPQSAAPIPFEGK